MDCPACFQPFEEGKSDPHILIGCGHSICKECIESKIPETDSNNSIITIVCPDCGKETQAQDITWFPKNIALLNMVKSTLSVPENQNDKSPTRDRPYTESEDFDNLELRHSHTQRASDKLPENKLGDLNMSTLSLNKMDFSGKHYLEGSLMEPS